MNRGAAGGRGAAALSMVTVVTTVLALAVPPAGAHGGGGAITLVDIHPTGPDTVSLEVCVTFTLDRDQADTARVTVRAQGPEDAEVASAPMEVGSQPGLRNGDLTFPSDGSWTVVVESTFPLAQLSVPITVGGDDRSSPAATALDNDPTAGTCEGESEGAPTWLVAGLGGAAAVAVFGGLLLLLRRASTPPAET